MIRKNRVVAIDGPAGSGKSTVSSTVCQSTGWIYLSTGLLYRAVGLIGEEKGLNLDDEISLGQLIDSFKDTLRWDSKTGHIFYQSRNLSPEIGSVRSGNNASRVAKLPLVREKLLPIQRSFITMAHTGVVMDGRDIGTVVYPEADLKIFMIASLEERAKRRILQLSKEKSPKKPQTFSPELLTDMMRDIAQRDLQDSSRKSAPLKKADDALELDTSGLTFDEVVEKVISLMKERKLLP